MGDMGSKDFFSLTFGEIKVVKICINRRDGLILKQE